jgi:hypothetical protein
MIEALKKQIFQNARNDHYHVATTGTIGEASELMTISLVGVHEYHGAMIYRKRKLYRRK